MSARMKFSELVPELVSAVSQLELAVRQSGIDPQLLHLIKLRASQLNHCAYCVWLHTREGLDEGIDSRKLYLLTVWEESHLYTPRERGAGLDRDRDAGGGDGDPG